MILGVTIWTVGHSTRSAQDLLEILHAHRIESLADIRAFPASRRLPHFNREALEQTLPQSNIEYHWFRELGGRRKRITKDSPHVALRSESFRNYADYMLTPEFHDSIVRLLAIAANRRTAYMCAEKMYFQCHRMMVSDYLVAQGHEVLHIVDANREPIIHKLTAEARLRDGQLLYVGDRLL